MCPMFLKRPEKGYYKLFKENHLRSKNAGCAEIVSIRLSSFSLLNPHFDCTMSPNLQTELKTQLKKNKIRGLLKANCLKKNLGYGPNWSDFTFNLNCLEEKNSITRPSAMYMCDNSNIK